MDHALQHQHLGNAAGGVAEPLGLSVVWGRIMIHIQQRGPHAMYSTHEGTGLSGFLIATQLKMDYSPKDGGKKV